MNKNTELALLLIIEAGITLLINRPDLFKQLFKTSKISHPCLGKTYMSGFDCPPIVGTGEYDLCLGFQNQIEIYESQKQSIRELIIYYKKEEVK